jgi:uncharacterized protein (UPF0332 family)
MILQKEDRTALVTLRLQRSKETLAEVRGHIGMGYYRTAANRLYYACFYAVSALLISSGFSAHTHHGVISQLGLHFVAKGLISKEQGKMYKQLFELRQSGDYSDWFEICENDIKPLLAPAEQFIADIENLINNNS